MTFSKTQQMQETTKLYNIILNLKDQNYKFERDIVPNNITIEMLKMALDCQDLRSQQDIEIKTLWNAYYVNNFKINEFGIYIDNIYDKEESIKKKLPLIEKIEKDESRARLLSYHSTKNPLLNKSFRQKIKKIRKK